MDAVKATNGQKLENTHMKTKKTLGSQEEEKQPCTVREVLLHTRVDDGNEQRN